nr:PREDICTED: zinc finger protein 280D isoform X2 [Anolis carolinensis]|eukprot:XP_008119797.1 PREDICTED: zinc finger protein 280D isoform X2 [Anolis carolinensis]
MAELFMECEEEELEPWQQKEKPIVVDDDDDDEPIFMGEILSAKPSSSYILNRVNPGSPRIGIQNGATKRGFQPTTRPATSTLAVQPQPRLSSSAPGTPPALQRPLSGCSGPQEAVKTSPSLSQPISLSPSLCRNLSLPGLAQSASRPVATVTAQPVTLTRVTPNNSFGFGLRPNSGELQCQGGSMVNFTGLSKRPSTSEADGILPKKAKGDGGDSPELISVQSPSDSFQKGILSTNMKNGAPFPQACPKCNIHFNLLEPLKNHIKYCCPEMVPSFLGAADCSGPWASNMEAEPGKLIMLVNDFYYGKHEGNVQQVRQEQKTHTTFKCASCMKHLKSNVRFMNHMKHHLELEKQNSESWESHTTCQHCFRQFPTPFQLQCHIETTHTPHECSTICKICELSFETEQILLQHMKDNHKPGEMPYVCQVCGYRSSVFSDVDKHFRAVHENTKNLLCPFCLKVIKIGAPYMHHFMRHQKKGVHRCTKCRLQFLTCKEKLEHKSQHHRTFKKPAQLEGLPPGTKVTIRASAGSLQTVSPSSSFVSANASVLQLSPPPGPYVADPPWSPPNRLSAGKSRSKPKPPSLQRRESLGNGNSSSTSSTSSSNGGGGGGSKKNSGGKVANTGLSHLRCPDIQKCIECNSDIRTFANHFPAYVHCSLCRYSTSCSKAYGNHMISFHSARPTKRFWMYKEQSEELKDLTLVCMHCDFVADLSAMDKMAAHLSNNDTHECQVILEKAPTDASPADNPLGPSSEVSLKDESEERTQELSGPAAPKEEEEEEQQQPCPESLEIKEEDTKDHLVNPSEEVAKNEEGEEDRAPAPESSSGPELPSGPIDALCASRTEKAGSAEGCAATEGEEAESPVAENTPAPSLPACAEHSLEEGSGKHQDDDEEEALSAAEETVPTSCSEDASSLEPHPCPEQPSGGGNMEDLSSPGGEGPADMECEESPAPSGLEDRPGPELPSLSEDPTDAAGGSEDPNGAAEISNDPVDNAGGSNESDDITDGSEDPIDAAEGSKNPIDTVRDSEDSTDAAGSSEDPIDTAGSLEDPIVTAAVPLSQEGGFLAAGCEEQASPAPGNEGSPSEPSQNSIDAAGGGRDADCSLSGGYEFEGSASSPLVPEGGPPACGEDLGEAAEEEEEEEEEETGPGTPHGCEESPSPSTADAPASAEDDPMDAAGEGDATNGLPEDGDASLATEPLASPLEAGTSPVSSLEAETSPVPSSDDALETSGEEGKEEADWALSPAQGDEDGASLPEADLESNPGPEGSLKEDGEGVPLPSPAKSPSSVELQPQPDDCRPGSATEEALEEDAEEEEGGDGGQEDGKSAPSPRLEGQAEESDEGELADVRVEGAEWASDEDVGFAQFFQRRGEAAVVAVDGGDEVGGGGRGGGSVRLEPLTPSEVLEHEATEILQKKGGGSSSSEGPASPGPEEEREEEREELGPEAS